MCWNFSKGEEFEAAPPQAFTLQELRDGVLILTLQLWDGNGEQVIYIRRKRYQAWFVCEECGRLVRKLYRPPGEAVLSCRRCWNLTDMSGLKRDGWSLGAPRKFAVTARLEHCQK